MKKGIVLSLVLSLLSINIIGCGNQITDVSKGIAENIYDVSTDEEVNPISENAVTEEEVVELNYSLLKCVDNIKSLEGTLAMSIKMQIPMTEEETEHYVSLGNDASNAFHKINVGTELSVATTDTLTHYSGNISKVTDSVTAIPISCYVDESAKQMYDLMYNESTGSQIWVKNGNYTKSFLTIVKDIVGNTTNTIENDASSTRIVKGTVNSKFIHDIPCFQHLNNEYFTLNTENNIGLPIKITINTKTGYLSALEITLDDLMVANNVDTFTTEPLKLVVKNTNSTNISIPSEALNTTGEGITRVDDDISVYGKYFKSIYAPTEEDATDFITLEIINSVIGHQYDNLLATKTETSGNLYTETLGRITDFLNYYSVTDLQTYMDYYKYCPDDEQVALCIVAQLGIPGFDEAFMQETCIGPNTTLHKIVITYMKNNYLLTNEEFNNLLSMNQIVVSENEIEEYEDYEDEDTEYETEE